MHGRSFEARTLALGLLVLAAPLVGCGGSSGPPNCGIEQPCGGDVVGAWSFAGVCSNVAASSAELMAICPGASIGGSSISLTGSLEFSAEEVYTASNWHETFSLTEIVPLSCAGTGITSCSQNDGTVTDTQNGVTITITTTCTGTTVCTCRLSGNLSIVTDVGYYTITGTTLDMLGPATTGTFPYCVEEKRLHLMALSTTMTTPMGQAVITSDIVAQRQLQ